MSQDLTTLPLTHKAFSSFHSDVSNAFQAFVSSFSGATAPASPVDGQLWYDTVNHTLNVRVNGTWQTLPIRAYANFGTTALATANGDLAAGLDAGDQIFWDQSTGLLTVRNANSGTEVKAELGIVGGYGYSALYDASDALRIVLTGSTGSIALKNASSADRVVLDGATGFANIGSATDAAAVGDFAAGTNTGARMFYDQSAGAFYLYNASGAVIHQLRNSSSCELNATLVDIDTIINGDDREIVRANAGDNSLEITGMTRYVPQTVAISSDAVSITSTLVLLTCETGTADNIATINAGTGVTLRDGMRISIRTANSGDTITVKDGTGNIECAADQAMSSQNHVVELQYVAATSKWVATGVRITN